MISVYISCHELCEGHKLEDMLNDVMVQFGEEETATDLRSSEGSFQDNNMGLPDIIIYELRNREDYYGLRELRGQCPHARLIMINRSSIPSLKLLEPGINPDALAEDLPSGKYLRELMRKMIMTIYKAREELSAGERLLVKQGDEFFMIRYSQITYIEARDKYIIVHFQKGCISYRDTLKMLERRIPSCFVRCHRSIIVNLLYVHQVHLSMRNITLEDGTVVPLSKSYRNKLKAQLLPCLMD